MSRRFTSQKRTIGTTTRLLARTRLILITVLLSLVSGTVLPATAATPTPRVVAAPSLPQVSQTQSLAERRSDQARVIEQHVAQAQSGSELLPAAQPDAVAQARLLQTGSPAPPSVAAPSYREVIIIPGGFRTWDAVRYFGGIRSQYTPGCYKVTIEQGTVTEFWIPGNDTQPDLTTPSGFPSSHTFSFGTGYEPVGRPITPEDQRAGISYSGNGFFNGRLSPVTGGVIPSFASAPWGSRIIIESVNELPSWIPRWNPLNETGYYCQKPELYEPRANAENPCLTENALDPVDLRTGAWYFDVPCLSLGGAGLPINIGLHYNTKHWAYGRTSTSVGNGWIVDYTRRLVYNAVTKQAIIYYENGDTGVYDETSPGTFTQPAGWTSLRWDTGSSSFVLTYRNGTQERYAGDGSGRLLQRVDRFGNATNLVWTTENSGALGVLTVQNNRTGQSLRMEHEVRNENGVFLWKLLRITDGLTNGGTRRTATLTYDSAGRLTRVTDVANRVYAFAYDSLGRIDTFYDPNNNPDVLGAAARAVRNTYADGTNNVSYRVVSQRSRDGKTATIAYNTGHNLVLTYNAGQADQRVIRYDYNDGWGNIRYTYHANSSTYYSDFEYNSDGLLISAKDTLGRRIGYTYTNKGDLRDVNIYSDCCQIASTTRFTTDSTYGQLLSIEYPDGGVTRWTYNATNGALQTMVREGTINGTILRQTTTFRTDAVTINGQSVQTGLITAVQLPDGTWNTLAYDSRGYPTATVYDANVNGNTGRLALSETTQYDWRGFLQTTTDMRGVQSRYEYAQNPSAGQFGNDGLPSAMVVDSASGGRQIRTEISYDAVGNITRVVDDAGSGKLNATTRYTLGDVGFEGNYAVTQHTNPLNQVVRYTYTPFGELSTVVEVGALPAGGDRTTTLTTNLLADGWERITRLHDSRVVETMRMNTTGQPTQVRDAVGATSNYLYDGQGRLQTIRQGTATVGTKPALNAETSYEYDALDRVKKVIGKVDATTTRTLAEYQYDQLGRLFSEKDGAGREVRYEYDSQRDFLRFVRAGFGTADQINTEYQYDRLGRMSREIVDPGTGRKNLTTQYNYATTGADRGMLQQVIEPEASHSTRYTYNSLGLLETVTDAANSVWRYTYNNLGYLTQMQEPRTWVIETYQPDLLGRTTQLSRLGLTESWQYNVDGTLRQHTDFGSKTTRYIYDNTGRATGIDYNFAGSTPVADASFAYRNNDLLQSATSTVNGQARMTSYDYDALNRLDKRSRTGVQDVTYGYNLLGQVTSLTSLGQATTYEYAPTNGLLTGVTPWNAGKTTYEYRATNQLKAIARPGSLRTDMGYDTAGRLTSMNTLAGTQPRSQLNYTLDNNGNVLSQAETVNGTSWGTTNYQYDVLNRLTQAAYPGIANGPGAKTDAFTYDQVGNRISASPNVWYRDDFEDGDSADWQFSGGTWQVVTEGGSRALKKTGSETTPRQAVLGNSTWTNYTVQADVTITRDAANTNAGVRGRVQSDTTFYQLVLANTGTSKVWLLQKSVNGTFTNIASGPYAYNLNQLYTLRLSFDGQWLIAQIRPAGATSDTTLAVVQDTNAPIASGRAGVASWASDARFDNIVLGEFPSVFDNFSDGNTDGWQLNGTGWRVQGSNLALTKTGTDFQSAFVGGGTWRDYSVQATVTITRDVNDSNTGILGHVQGNQQYYQLVLNKDATGRREWILLKNNNGTFSVLGRGDYAWNLNTPYTLGLEFAGTQILPKISTNGGASFQYLGAFVDASAPFLTGRGGVMSWKTDARFDDVLITPLELRYDGRDRILNSGFSYDGAGNLTSTPDGTTYTYDGANRLSRTQRWGVTTDYEYDALGNLVQQRVTRNGTTTTTDLTLDENTGLPQVLGSTTNTGATTRYAFGATGLHAVQNPDATTRTTIGDRLGSVRSYADGVGVLTRIQSYDAWGVPRFANTPSGQTALGFTGEQELPDGNIHLRARAYNPSLGRVLQRDTFAGFAMRPQSANRYAYVEGNPTNYVDPSGHTARNAAQGAAIAERRRNINHPATRFERWLESIRVTGGPKVGSLGGLAVDAHTPKDAPFQGAGVTLPLASWQANSCADIDLTDQFGPLWVRGTATSGRGSAGLLLLPAREGGTGLLINGGFFDFSALQARSEYVLGDKADGFTFTSEANPLRVHGFGGVVTSHERGRTKNELGASVFVAPGSVIMSAGINFDGINVSVFIEPVPKLEVPVTNARGYPRGGRQGVRNVVGVSVGPAIGPEANPESVITRRRWVGRTLGSGGLFP